MDEKSPHMHYIFLPVMPNKDFGKNTKSGKYKFRLNAKKVISKTELQRAHPDLQKFLREQRQKEQQKQREKEREQQHQRHNRSRER